MTIKKLIQKLETYDTALEIYPLDHLNCIYPELDQAHLDPFGLRVDPVPEIVGSVLELGLVITKIPEPRALSDEQTEAQYESLIVDAFHTA